MLGVLVYWGPVKLYPYICNCFYISFVNYAVRMIFKYEYEILTGIFYDRNVQIFLILTKGVGGYFC